MSSPRTFSHNGLLSAGLLVMTGLLLVREFVPEGPIAWISLVAGVIALAFIISACVRAARPSARTLTTLLSLGPGTGPEAHALLTPAALS
ncbi:hypothetical protein M3B11_03220 [Brevibacterium sp. p3-SID960]|uniref:hypothetical protein n=1 Tax=Brevibacterium sp. p3-SID960 TaxID=2916063 RepID=UPI0021A2842C|nr:hypothetical protein [Brevibacterium sp. p3-SID960]MCT1689977.1 hypothetical protein [Brevibacterium sp. p3-SID960]